MIHQSIFLKVFYTFLITPGTKISEVMVTSVADKSTQKMQDLLKRSRVGEVQVITEVE